MIAMQKWKRLSFLRVELVWVQSDETAVNVCSDAAALVNKKKNSSNTSLLIFACCRLVSKTAEGNGKGGKLPKSHLYLTVSNIIFYVKSLSYPGKTTGV